jgi:hypothetical protein
MQVKNSRKYILDKRKLCVDYTVLRDIVNSCVNIKQQS